MLSLIIAFLAGGIVFLTIGIASIILYIYWLPSYIAPLPTRPYIKFLGDIDNLNSDEIVPTDSQLFKKGWLRISNDPLTENQIYSEPFEMPDYILKSKSIRELKKPSSISLSDTVNSVYKTASFLFSKFRGDQDVSLPIENNSLDTTSVKTWRNLFATLNFRNLLFHSSSNLDHVYLALFLPDFKVSMDFSKDEPFFRDYPIILTHKSQGDVLYIYASSGFEKEDWFYKLVRSSKLPLFMDNASMASFYHDLQPVKAYENAMEKLINTLNKDDVNSPIWLNAIIGRAFISIHSNPRIKNWIIDNITRRMAHVHRDSNSFLGDIIITDLDVGNSIPVITNPKLISISKDGDMNIELDIEYTGCISIELATAASISVNAWTEYIKPINVPIVVRATITKFSARMLVKIKPLWESTRIWFGFYRHPELVLELKLEPIISNKLVKLDLVNQVIETRIKDALEDFVILPNMEDFVFWPFKDDLEYEDESEYEEEAENETINSKEQWKESIFEGAPEANHKMLKKNSSLLSLNTENEDLGAIGYLKNSIPDDEFDYSQDALNYMGNAAFQLGKIARNYDVEGKGRTVANTLKPAVSFIDKSTKNYRKYLFDSAAKAGLGIVKILGLKKENSMPKIEIEAPTIDDEIDKIQRENSSHKIDILGVSISTFSPSELEGSPSLRRRKRNIKKASSLASLKNSQNNINLSRSVSDEVIMKSESDLSNLDINKQFERAPKSLKKISSLGNVMTQV